MVPIPRPRSANSSMAASVTRKSHGCELCGFEARIPAPTIRSAGVAPSRQRVHGSYAGPLPTLNTPWLTARHTPPAATAMKVTPPSFRNLLRVIAM